MPTSEQTEHEDWHFATELDRELRSQGPSPSNNGQSKQALKDVKPSSRGRDDSSGRGDNSSKGVGKGQSRLMFGKG
jgi:DNA polymerase eta